MATEPVEAFNSYLTQFQKVLGCVAHPSVTVGQRTRLRIGSITTLGANGMNPIVVSGSPPLRLILGEVVSIEADARPDGVLVRVEPRQYLYHVETESGFEVLAFHWMSELANERAMTFPHLHLGPALISSQSSVRVGTLHKAHIPTGHVSMAAVVRMLIEEFGVRPLRPEWKAILDAAHP